MILTEEDKQWLRELLEERLQHFETSLVQRLNSLRKTNVAKTLRPKLRINESHYIYIDQISSIKYIPASEMRVITVEFVGSRTEGEGPSEQIAVTPPLEIALPSLEAILTIKPKAAPTIKLTGSEADDVWEQYRNLNRQA